MHAPPLALGLAQRVDGRGAPQPLLLPANHLITHGVIVGMTGSGKTGLALVTCEEALRVGIPVLMIDVKGDLPNLLLAFSTFGHPPGERTARVQEAVRILDSQRVDFEYDGEMAADVALNKDLMAAYPFCRLTDTANVLIMPAFHSASISTRMLQELGGATVIGPLIVGLDRAVQIVPLGAKDADVVNMAALAAFNIGG